MGFQLYESRILALENDYLSSKQEINRLLRRLKHKRAIVDIKRIRTQLDFLNGLVRLIREQHAFYLKLGSKFDLLHFHEEFVDELRRRDPQMMMEIIAELDRRWTDK